MELDDLWFMDFKFIPKADISHLLAKYDEEALNFFGQHYNGQKSLEKYLSKLLKQDLPTEELQNIPKSYCMKVKYPWQSKRLSFIIIINETNLNQLEFKVHIRKSVFQMFLENNHNDLISYFQNLINYFQKEVLGKIFPEHLICELPKND